MTFLKIAESPLVTTNFFENSQQNATQPYSTLSINQNGTRIIAY